MANLYKVQGKPVPIRHKPSEKEKAEPKARSHDIEKTVMATEDRLGCTLGELERRLTLGGARRRLMEKMLLHPYRYGFMALFSGFAASFFVARKFRI